MPRQRSSGEAGRSAAFLTAESGPSTTIFQGAISENLKDVESMHERRRVELYMVISMA